MIYYLKLYLRDYWINVPLIIGILAQIFMWIYLPLNIETDTGSLFLHYNIVFGVDLVGPWWEILYVPISGLIILLLNGLFSYFIHKADKLLSRLLFAWAAFSNIFLVVVSILLIQINS